ncbi:acetyl xylan esterase [Sphaerosporella brunnea]|uniref:Carboxylic ester hydrolase n=1 Tax=Sphaerosporella brunnea TaxID=1250544 RepID=A0A5J5F5L7_9PEZI|nr:acetyl xylan esterase [Sphaerosporella brunnea]
MAPLGFFFSALAALSTTVFGASLQQVTNFGTNPTGAGMYIYVPDSLPTNPAILVAIHYCTGTAQAYFTGTQFASLADQYGYIVIYPNAPDSGGCWDVHSAATLSHNAGGDSLSIVNMVRYTISTYKADSSRVFAAGTSSGAMMCEVLAGAYPDVFAGVAGFAGVPFSCFAGPNMWNSDCANGNIDKTGAQWGDLVRAAYPGYTGPRPKLQLWHGTADTTLSYNNLGESVKEWTNVLGLSTTPTSTQQNSPLSGWTRNIYGSGQLQAITAQGVTHNIPVQASDVLAFFGLNQTPTTSPGTSTTTTTAPGGGTTTVTPPSGGTVPKWGQCGGTGYTGPTACVTGTTCIKMNDWYSQCQ